MLGNRSIGLRTLSLASLLVLVTASFWAWILLWESWILHDRDSLQRAFLYWEFLLVGVLFAAGGASTKTRGPFREVVDAVRRGMRQGLAGACGLLLVRVALADTVLGAGVIVGYVPLLACVLVLSHYQIPRLLAGWSFSGERQERVALAGTLDQAERMRPWLDRKRLLGLRTVGLVFPERALVPPEGAPCPYPVLGDLDAIGEILRRAAITQLIVMDLSLGRERLSQLTQLCEGASVRLLAVHDLDSYFTHRTTTFEDEGVRFVGVRDEPLESPINRFLKRAMDLAIAVPVVLLVLPPCALAVWLLHRLQSPGPLFFRQSRIGIMGRPFPIYKFRTMHVHRGEEAVQASRGDPRAFPAGRWLRRLSIDEIPQFLNVLRGEMSVVGPRPHLLKHEEMWSREMNRYVIRRFIRPGITGWAQVQGFRGEIRTQADIQRRVEADIHYLENWSFSLDLAIVLRTVKQCVLPPASAY